MTTRSGATNIKQLQVDFDAFKTALAEELRTLKEDHTKEIDELKTEIIQLKSIINVPPSPPPPSLQVPADDLLHKKVDDLAMTVMNHQKVMQKTDEQRRELNVIISGVPDVADADDGECIASLLADLECSDVKVVKIPRLGKTRVPVEGEEELLLSAEGGEDELPRPRVRPRPLLVVTEKPEEKWKILKSSSKLKEMERWSKVYINKDEAPHTRK